MKIDRAVREKAWRAFLHYMPMVPGPELVDLFKQITRSQRDVDDQVREALESIQRTADIVSTLDESLKDRAARLDDLRKQHHHLSQLTSIEAEKAAALLKQVETTVGKHRAREHALGFFLHILAGIVLFILGVFLSDWFKGLLHSASTRLLG